MIKHILIISIFAISLSACYYDKADKLYPADPNAKCDTVNMKYTLHVAPILKTNCLDKGCHTTAKPDAGFILDNYAGTKASVNNNKLVGSLKALSGFSAMPKGYPKLDDCDITKIEAWIKRGMPE